MMENDVTVHEEGELDKRTKEMLVEIGKSMRKIRKRQKLSIESMSEIARISPSYLGAMERGVRTPSLKTLLRISELLGVKTRELFSLGEKPTEGQAWDELACITLFKSFDEGTRKEVIEIMKAIKRIKADKKDEQI